VQELINVFFSPEIIVKVWPFLLQGLITTVELSLLVIPMGLVGGLTVALFYNQGSKFTRTLVILFIDIFRSFPPLVLLILIYFGLPFLQIEISKISAVAVCFILNTSSYYGEVFRAGLESVPKGQMEAARASGLNLSQSLLYVIIPQSVRNVLPELISNTVEVIKLTSLASVVALPELLNNARQAQSLTYNPTPIVLAALMYLVILWPMVRLLSLMEHKSSHVK